MARTGGLHTHSCPGRKSIFFLVNVSYTETTLSETTLFEDLLSLAQIVQSGEKKKSACVISRRFFNQIQNIYQVSPIKILSFPESLGYVKARAFRVTCTPQKISPFALASPFLFHLSVMIQGYDKISEFRNRQMSRPEDAFVKFDQLRTLLP